VSFTVDANVLLYASDESSRYHEPAESFLRDLAGGPEIAYVFWPTVMAYLRIATHPTVFTDPLTSEEALANVESLLALPHVRTAGEQDRFWRLYVDASTRARARGNLVPDGHVVALMLENGVRTIWTHDRDYRRFDEIEVRDPFD
jgi:toxin-antitoxin system PIN domain toxin